MAQVSACDYRDAPVDCPGSLRDCPSEGKMLFIGLQCEAQDDNRPRPPGFAQIVKRNERAVIERAIANNLAQLHALSRSRTTDGREHLKIIIECKVHIRRVKFSKIAL